MSGNILKLMRPLGEPVRARARQTIPVAARNPEEEARDPWVGDPFPL